MLQQLIFKFITSVNPLFVVEGCGKQLCGLCEYNLLCTYIAHSSNRIMLMNNYNSTTGVYHCVFCSDPIHLI